MEVHLLSSQFSIGICLIAGQALAICLIVSLNSTGSLCCMHNLLLLWTKRKTESAAFSFFFREEFRMRSSFTLILFHFPLLIHTFVSPSFENRFDSLHAQTFFTIISGPVLLKSFLKRRTKLVLSKRNSTSS